MRLIPGKNILLVSKSKEGCCTIFLETLVDLVLENLMYTTRSCRCLLKKQTKVYYSSKHKTISFSTVNLKKSGSFDFDLKIKHFL